MAEILIKLGDPDANPLSWQRLYPVDVKPDGWEWGARETWPDFAVIRITNITVDQAKDYITSDDISIVCPRCTGSLIDPVHTLKQCVRCSGIGSIQKTIGLRKWKIDLDDVNVPKSMINLIKSGQPIVVTKDQVISFIKRVNNG
jgi:hypothetical protein